ncbi:spore coat protein [Paenibacillus sp. MBLB2552]|uniref:Spore coat protein n=1 Tax=Paenibacillus mellifer TaxID=2937794 RepID=A0A9X2BTV9_9BACL|nr:spore coat protein [Paenibacillus mellifer]MCK8488361.1 spore coat protein [Paenibacillus mellifer]
MMRNWGAHEFLETNELLRKLTADIELHALFAGMTNDQALRTILQRHIQMMDGAYHQVIRLMQFKGMDVSKTTAAHRLNLQQTPHVGFQQPQSIPAPSVNVQQLSDMTISTILLNSHKAGSAIGMLWAAECVDPDVRSLHVMCANNCQQMAYEMFQFMNERGYYEVPAMPQADVSRMASLYQYVSPAGYMSSPL